ncbi:MAG TPA: hypothetical protein VGY13_02975 [Solirubrobacteraceae bacterium]|jgi:hypothetical protein|nr:hypothetical protein [Solirubrobacteraceae bacterium]
MAAVRPRLRLVPASATPEEAAAIVAALERFMRASAPQPHGGAAAELDGWQRAALLEGVSRDPWASASDPHFASHWTG